ncbi:2'-5' RNA ligase [Hymenobacter luteus]|uniref:2'-5' RNA ligase n=2 Tax=Hymenobacter TaxID=89966 RepID=A0A7W9SZH7_9BACT|nr:MULTISPECIES: 2'-5' RNA ligase family protein [Hymenobacter]MBB4601177.1 2'-5' RNA ligase [Hymenobacter latericoloratus]MBB6058616.1 2'-5' RNA ligase [Hymenobacter luteus]
MLLPLDAPLILTLTLDEAAQAHFNALRQQYFPPERNYLQAHVTLFHHLPGPEARAITEYLARVAATTPPLPLQVAGLRFLGRGVAYDLHNPELLQLHRSLQTAWAAWLTPQDQQRLKPHITVQNKVEPAVARALHQQLTAEFMPFEAAGTGLTLWAYRNGPWEQLQQFPFVG